VSSSAQESPNPQMGLLPHQISFVNTVLMPNGNRVTLLRADVGLGKGAALVALSKRLLQERPAARVLILVPKAVQFQFAESLREEGVSALLVDRYQFRELLDATSQVEIWPRGVILVLSMDFAKQCDIRESLAITHWELVIADEAHMFTGTRGETLRRVEASAERVVLASATRPNFEWLVQGEDITVVDWRRDRLVDNEGKLLYTAPRPAINELSFKLTPSELSVRAMVMHLCDVLEGNSGLRSWVAKFILRSLDSSQLAIENGLRDLSGRLGGDSELEPSPEIAEGDSDDDETLSGILSSAANQTSPAIEEVIEAIDDLAADSKLAAFGELLGRLLDTKGPSRRIYVLTDYLATLYYLAAEIEERDMKCMLLHGGMSVDERKRALSSLATVEAILVATRAAIIDHFSLADVTDVVLYDIPANKIVLERLLSRFDQFGRKAQLTVHVLVPSNVSDGLIFESLRVLRNVTDPEQKPLANE
jgi:hypothetical protein